MENKTKRQNIMRYFSCIFSFILVINLSGCGYDKQDKAAERIEQEVETRAGSGKDVEFGQEVQSFKLEGFSKSGENTWSVEGEFANIVGQDIILHDIQGFSRSEDMNVEITATKGIYNRTTNSAELIGNVIIKLADGGRAYMDKAKWSAKDEEITTDTAVRIEHSGIVIEGIKATVQPQKEWALLEKQIKLTDESGRVITCDGPLEVVYKDKKAILNNNVVILDPQGTMYADQVIAHFDDQKREISRIEWLGNVKAVY